MRIGTTFILDVMFDQLVELARAAERDAFDAIWFGDAPLTPTAQHDDFKVVMDPIVALGVCLAVTGLDAGPGVLLLPHREPIATAKAIAYAQHASGGRVLLGVGQGWREPEYGYFGIDKRTRGRRFDAALDAMDALFAGTPTYSNEFYGWTDADPVPAVERPRTFIGGNSRAAMERALARNAGWMPVALGVKDFTGLATEYLERGGTALAARVRVGADAEVRGGLGGSQAIETLLAWRELGVAELSLVFGRDVETVRTNNDWFVTDVMPQLRR